MSRHERRAKVSRLRKSKMSFDQQIAGRPLPHNSCGAFCMTCRQPSDSELIVEEKRGLVYNMCRVLVRCHGLEELREFEFGSSEWDSDDLKRAMQRCAWFDPMGHESVPLVPNAGRINDPGDAPS